MWFMKKVEEICQSKFNLNYEKQVRGNNAILIYGNFGDPKATTKAYEEIPDHDSLKVSMEYYLEEYNADTSVPMNLVLFMNAIEHISRISRVINQPKGNALLVGVGGSGRKSVTRLAVFVAEFEMFQIEISKTYGKFEWREDLKAVFNLAGVENKPTVFLFSDTQIVQESFLEDVNGILNTGEVANLFNSEEMQMLLENVGPKAAKAGHNTNSPAEIYNYFVETCCHNLHMVLAMSPIGEAFRRRLRMFPALVNCCTIDWFTEWPQEALLSVANHFLASVELDQETKTGVVDVCVVMQEKVTAMSKQFLASLRRHYYVTPTSYLELIGTFKKVLETKRTEVAARRDRYANGLEKLADTSHQVKGMQEELTALKPQLILATKETDALLVTIQADTVVANETKHVVEGEEKICNKQAAEANALKESCENDLAKAIPALKGAVAALKTLSKSDIVEVKAMKKPPPGVKLTMEAVCLMMRVPPNKIKDPEGGTKKIEDFWGPAQKVLLSDPRFMTNLIEYDKDNITDDIIDKVSPYTEMPTFQPDIVKKASVAAAGLCKWVHAMITYSSVAKVVAPKKEMLKVAVGELEAASAALKLKQDVLAEVVGKLDALNAQLKEAQEKKQNLQDQVEDCKNKLDRAEALINGLGGERSRWTDMVQKLQADYDNVVGDIVLSAGIIGYLGPFTMSFRTDAVTTWASLLKAKNIPCSNNFKLAEVLGDPVQIRGWTIDKLPNDSFSIENAIMLFESNRWPLMIDPQGQANRWVRNMEVKNELKVVKQNQSDFVRCLENAMQFGRPVLLENVPEYLDPILDTVLAKQITTAGGVCSIRLGDNTVEYDPHFRLYITTKLTNPHYPPETCVRVNLLNYMATQEGLQDQMLGITVAREEPALEAEREQLVIDDAENKRQLKEIEDTILRLLKESTGNILDDSVLTTTLSESKATSNLIEEKVKEAAKTQKLIEETRISYIPVAFRSSQLFFCIADLLIVDPMYQYSLEWFVGLFLMAIENAEKSDVLSERIENLNDTFTYVLYVNVCRSLFEKDKLLFSFLLCMKILIGDERASLGDLRFFLQVLQHHPG
jgi:dynein heavy chain